MRLLVIAAVLALSTSAFAQQQAASPTQQALANKLLQEIDIDVQDRAALVNAKAEIADLKKQLEEATAKLAHQDNK